MQAGVSQWHLWANHSLQSLHSRKGPDQGRVSPLQCWKLRKLELGRHLRPCVGKSFSCWCCCVSASKNPVATRNHVAKHWTFAMLKEWTLALRPLFNVLPVLQIDRTFVQQSSSYRPQVLKRGHTCRQVSASDTCERTILFRVSIFAKGWTKEESLLCNVESWENLSLTDTSDLVLGRALVADAAVWQASRNPVATRNHVAEASSMSCQRCQLIGDSCSNPAHIHQYWRKSTHAGVSQWPLW